MPDDLPALARLRDATQGLAPPPGFSDGVRARVAAASAWSISARLSRWSLGFAAAAAIVAVLAAASAQRELAYGLAAADLGALP